MVLNILLWSVLGILGSFLGRLVRHADQYLRQRPHRFCFFGRQGVSGDRVLPLRSGMSIGVLLICVELIMMITILLFIPRENAGACFIGFCHRRIFGRFRSAYLRRHFHQNRRHRRRLDENQFSKSMKTTPATRVFIADCTGDNAGDSVGPTADGFFRKLTASPGSL